MTGRRNYSAAGTRPVKLGKLKFKSRRRYCSIFVHGFILDEIAKVGEIARMAISQRRSFVLSSVTGTTRKTPMMILL
jgi:hypothetical protein